LLSVTFERSCSRPANNRRLDCPHVSRESDREGRAGLAGGEREARRHDVFLARPRGWRNQVWETDHVQAPVLVGVEGTSRRPWITWFTDCATNAITGVAVTPVHPSRESVLAALRSAVLREDPYGPFGGLPEKVRVDRGKDFLSRTVTAAFDLLDVTVEDLPAYTPHLKPLSSHCTSSGRCGVFGVEDAAAWSADDGPNEFGAGQGVDVLALVVGQDAGDDAVPAPVLDGLEVDSEVAGEFGHGQHSRVEEALAVAA
ncbi:integrase catalytic domain-containing protein, partial [Streptomyces atratus]|uniref:integrase catalytic domain-containing protein n=1 Tax=Streptomyces atratus TaxID=1893 RepID=UPI003F540853